MKFNTLLLLLAAAYIGWPYVNIYQLSNSLAQTDDVALTKLIDMDSVRKIYKENLKWRVSHTIGGQDRHLPDFMRGGAGLLGDAAVDSLINTDWLRKRLDNSNRPFYQAISFAFFESPTRFMIRVGELGHNPLHLQMNLQDWVWRVTAVYE
jgi:hypothetical protein